MTPEEIRGMPVPPELLAREGLLCELLREIAAQMAEANKLRADLNEICRKAD